MKISDIIGIGLLGAAIFCLIALIACSYLVPYYGECYIDEQGYKHCKLGSLQVISTEQVK